MPQFRYPVPDQPPDEAEFWVTAFNKKWLPIVIDAVDNLIHSDLFESPPDDIESQCDELVKLIMTSYDCEAAVTISKRSLMSHRDSIVTSGNAVAFQLNTAQANNGNFRQDPAARFDGFTNGFVAPPGDYILRLVCVRGSASGILAMLIDDEVIGSFDFYNVTTQNNYVLDIPVTIATNGYHVIQCGTSTKNASSTDYRIGIISMSVFPAVED